MVELKALYPAACLANTAARFNRSMVELKAQPPAAKRIFHPCFNRSMVELKAHRKHLFNRGWCGFNRSMEELKGIWRSASGCENEAWLTCVGESGSGGSYLRPAKLALTCPIAVFVERACRKRCQLQHMKAHRDIAAPENAA